MDNDFQLLREYVERGARMPSANSSIATHGRLRAARRVLDSDAPREEATQATFYPVGSQGSEAFIRHHSGGVALSDRAACRTRNPVGKSSAAASVRTASWN
jgi:hypothetical protein